MRLAYYFSNALSVENFWALGREFKVASACVYVYAGVCAVCEPYFNFEMQAAT